VSESMLIRSCVDESDESVLKCCEASSSDLSNTIKHARRWISKLKQTRRENLQGSSSERMRLQIRRKLRVFYALYIVQYIYMYRDDT
jgi:hypothetical protein